MSRNAFRTDSMMQICKSDYENYKATKNKSLTERHGRKQLTGFITGPRPRSSPLLLHPLQHSWSQTGPRDFCPIMQPSGTKFHIDILLCRVLEGEMGLEFFTSPEILFHSFIFAHSCHKKTSLEVFL